MRTADWPEHASVWVALDYWILAKGQCHGCGGCDANARVKRLRAAYRARR